jgi:hypothetical protein
VSASTFPIGPSGQRANLKQGEIARCGFRVRAPNFHVGSTRPVRRLALRHLRDRDISPVGRLLRGALES